MPYKYLYKYLLAEQDYLLTMLINLPCADDSLETADDNYCNSLLRREQLHFMLQYLSKSHIIDCDLHFQKTVN